MGCSALVCFYHCILKSITVCSDAVFALGGLGPFNVSRTVPESSSPSGAYESARSSIATPAPECTIASEGTRSYSTGGPAHETDHPHQLEEHTGRRARQVAAWVTSKFMEHPRLLD